MGSKRPAQGELFRNNLQKIWIRRAGGTSSSVRTVCDPELIVHFGSFLKTYVILHRGRVGSVDEGNNLYVIQVDPKTWALAFLQWNLTEATLILSQAVFTPTELDARNAASEDIAKLECLNEIKRRAITRAVLWMQNKAQDPWGYEASSKVSIINVPESEMLQINHGFLNFKKIEALPGFLLSEPFDTDMNGGPPGVFKDPLTNKTLRDSLTPNLVSILSPNDSSAEPGTDNGLALSFEEVFETVWGLVVFESHSVILTLLDLRSLTTPAQILKELTLYMIRDLTEVFVGAVQFDRTQFSVLERRRNLGFSQMVRSLFRMLYRRYNGNTKDSDPQVPDSKFISFREDKQAAVLLLSIIRIVKYLCQFEDNFEDKAKDFHENAECPFPDKSEMQEVFKVLKEVCPGKFEEEDTGMGTETHSGLVFEPCIPTPSNFPLCTNDTSQTVQIPFMDYNATLNASNLSRSYQSPMQFGEMNSQSGDCYTNMDLNSNSEDQISSPENSSNSSSTFDLVAAALSSVAPNNSPGYSDNGMWTNACNSHSYLPSPMNNLAYTANNFTSSEFTTTQSYESNSQCELNGIYENNSQQSSYQITPTPGMTPTPTNVRQMKQVKFIARFDELYYSSVILMDYPHHEFNLNDLIHVYEAVKGATDKGTTSKKDVLFEGGKELFRKMFTQDEIKYCNLKGRRTGEQKKGCSQDENENANPNGRQNTEQKRGFFTDPILKVRSNALLDILPVLAALIEQKMPLLPVEMPPDNIINVSVEVNDLLRNILKHKIFTEYRYQLSVKVKPNES